MRSDITLSIKNYTQNLSCINVIVSKINSFFECFCLLMAFKFGWKVLITLNQCALESMASHRISIRFVWKKAQTRKYWERERKMSIEYGKGVYVGTCFITKCPLGLNGGIKYHLKYNETEIYCNVTKELCDEGEKKNASAHTTNHIWCGHFSIWIEKCGRDAEADIKHRIKFHSKMSLSLAFGFKYDMVRLLLHCAIFLCYPAFIVIWHHISLHHFSLCARRF